MASKKDARRRRGTKLRAKLKELGKLRLCVQRSGRHIGAQIIQDLETGSIVLASASTSSKELRDKASGNKTEQATLIGKVIGEKAKEAGISVIAFDRSGFKYHGRVKALADAAREAGLEF